MKKILTIILLAVSGISAATTYTLDTMIDAGLKNSYSIRQKAIMIMNRGENLSTAYWELLPSADITAARNNNDGQYHTTGSLNFNKTISLTEPTLFNLKQARLDKEIAQLSWLNSKKEFVFNIYSSWLDLAELNREIEIQTQNMAVLKKISEQTDLQQKLGQRTLYDYRQSEINFINAELVLTELKNRFASKRAAMFNLVKLQDDGSELDFSLQIAGKNSPQVPEAKKSNIALEQLRFELRKSKTEKLQQKLGLLPYLYVSGRYEQKSRNNDILDFENYEDSYSLSAGFSWSLWSPWTKASSYTRIANNLTLKQWELEEQEAAFTLEKANFARDWEFLCNTLALNEKKLTQAEENLRMAQEKYNLGTLSLIELEQARVNSLDASLSANKIRFQLLKKIQEWNLLNSLPVLGKY